MKPLIIVLALLLAGTAWGQGFIDPGTEKYRTGTTSPYSKGEKVSTLEDARAIQIRAWAFTGEICRVLGHRWEYKQEWDNYTGNPCPKPKKEMRYCPICNKTETKKEVWE